ncbi:hypothetical protein ACWGI0_27140 [Streptomyces sp. NPDC054802]
MPSTVHRLEAALCAAAVGLLLTGCAGPESDDSSAAKPSAAPSPLSSPSSPPVSSAPALPEPTDGTDLTACADGRCEVAVRAGDTVAFTGDEVALKSFTVVRVAGNALTHKAAGPPGYTFSGSMSASGTSVVDGLRVKIVAVDGDRAVIRMS